MLNCNDELYTHEKALKFLYKKRGITTDTVGFIGLGIDLKKHRWVIPTFEYSTTIEGNILGFEYRPNDLSKKGLYREKNTPTGLAMINCYTPQVENLAIVEGYFDGYALWQYLDEKKQSSYYHIITPSNGVNQLLNQLSIVDFNKYKRYFLYVDSDIAGQKEVQKIIERYPIFEIVKMNCGCKDFNEHYLKCLK